MIKHDVESLTFIRLLSKLGRTEDILKAAVDKEYQEKLLKEFEL